MSEPPNNYRKPNNCPYCNAFVDAACRFENEEEKPEPDCLSVCINCAKVSIFDKDMKLQRFDMNTLDVEDHAYIVRIQYNAHGVGGRYKSTKKPKH